MEMHRKLHLQLRLLFYRWKSANRLYYFIQIHTNFSAITGVSNKSASLLNTRLTSLAIDIASQKAITTNKIVSVNTEEFELVDRTIMAYDLGRKMIVRYGVNVRMSTAFVCCISILTGILYIPSCARFHALHEETWFLIAHNEITSILVFANILRMSQKQL